MEISWMKVHKKHLSVPVMKYCLQNDNENLLKLLTSDTSVINFIHKKSGDSPVILAARHKHFEALSTLVQYGADIEHKNIDGKRALHEAAYSGCPRCVSLLINEGAQIDALKRADWTPLMISSCQGRLEIIKLLVSAGANVNRTNKDGWSCFHLACREGHVDVVKYILSVSKDAAMTVSKNGRTPLHTASMHGKCEVVEFLINKCNVTSTRDSCGTTPLMDAFRFGFINIASLFVESNLGNISVLDNLGLSCLHIAAHSGKLSCVKYLLENYFINVDMQCEKSLKTALHLSSKEGHEHIVKYLLFSGANINKLDINKRNPLHLATAASKVTTVQLLLNHGASANAVDINGKFPEDYAMNATIRELFKHSELSDI